MARSGITLKLDGFSEMIKQIEKANGNADRIVESVMRESAKIVEGDLKRELIATGDDSEGLAARMPAPDVTMQHGVCRASVGWEKGAYDPNNLSDGYKVVMLNYGTPNREKHGKVKARGFIRKAKRKATPKVKEQQAQAFKKIVEGLK